MIDENKLIRDRATGAAAEQELKQTRDAFAKLREQYVKAWMDTDPRDDKGREKLWIATTVLSKVEVQLRTVIANGKVADKELEALRKAGEQPTRLERAKRAFGR